MTLPEFSVKRPVTTIMIFVVVLILGVMALLNFNIDLLPKMTPPVVSVITAWPGASAQDVETNVTKHLEDRLVTVSNLDEITSKSLDNLSVISCKFKWGTDLQEATNNIRDMVDLAMRDLPTDVEKPMIFKLNTAMMPIMFIAVTSKRNYEELYHIVDKEISDRLKRVPGVGATIIYGGLKRQINIFLDKDKLIAYHMPVSRIIDMLKASNLNLPVGDIKLGKKDYFIRVPAKYKTVDEIKNTVVGSFKGKVIYLKDVATVRDSFKEVRMHAWHNGIPSVLMIIQKQSDANTVNVIDRIKKKLKEIQKILPGDVKIHIAMDNSRFIKHAISNLGSTLLWGIALVILVTYLFLRTFNASMIISMSIPFSLIAAFPFLYLGGYTLNIVSLSSLAIASGMVVDNSIVILENISRHIESGERRSIAAVIGSSEVGLAVMASTLTTVVVFAPLGFATGFTGVMFRQLAYTIIIVIMASLFVALTFIPMASSRLLGRKKIRRDRLGDRFFNWLSNIYGRLLMFGLSNRIVVIGIAIVVFFGAWLLFPFVGTEFVPDTDSGDVTITFQLPEGTRLSETDKIVHMAEKYVVKHVPEKQHYFGFDGQEEKGVAVALGMEEGSNVGEIGVKLVPKNDRKRSSKEIAYQIRDYLLRNAPGISKMTVQTGSAMRSVMLGTKPIVVDIQGDNLSEMVKIAKELKRRIEKIPGAVNVAVSQRENRPEIWIKINRTKASMLGVNIYTVASTLRTYYYGSVAGEFTSGSSDYDIRVKMQKDWRKDLQQVLSMPVPTVTGKMVTLGSFATIEKRYGPIEIDRKDRKRIVKVDMDVLGRSVGDVTDDVKKVISKMEIPPGVSISFSGDVEEKRKSFATLFELLILGIVLVYMVMASQFESFRDPFVIMFSVPFATTGVIVGLLITGTRFNIMSFLGLVMLSGIVVNNAIVMVDFTNLLRERGYKLFDAIVEAGKNRLRPVLMTTLTTFFGMLPLLLSRAEGSEQWRPLAAAMLGGLSVSTLITLLLVPVVYSYFHGREAR